MDAATKQQVVERVKQATNILVTVSKDPSVDQLASAVGMTLLLNKMGKHATAVFSGQIPSTLEFLQPEKTIETNTDSLRDFIISLDKSKADKLRYKVEDQFVRIFITPYRTSITEKDLVFSQGDFNVEVVLALGVKEQGQLDEAIVAHGRILHDATVISVIAGNDKPPQLGQINWQDTSASSLCEMLVSISEAFGPNLIDNQMATAFLTGIVAETARFSNDKTSPKVMTMSAQLMAAGANQQLIVSKLEPPEAEQPPPLPPPDDKPPQPPPPSGEDTGKKPEEKPPAKDGTLSVGHEGGQDTGEISVHTNEIHIDNEGNLKLAAELMEAERELADAQKKISEIKTQESALEEQVAKAQQPAPSPVAQAPAETPQLELPKPVEQPLTEATQARPVAFSAPSNEPPGLPEIKRTSMPGSHTLLTPQNGPLMEAPFSAVGQNDVDGLDRPLDPLSEEGPQPNGGMIGHAPDVQPPGPPAPPHEEKARSAVERAFEATTYNPGGDAVQALNAQPAVENINAQPAAPPFPPPLMPSKGVVIPPYPYSPPNGNQSA